MRTIECFWVRSVNDLRKATLQHNEKAMDDAEVELCIPPLVYVTGNQLLLANKILTLRWVLLF